MSADQEFGVVDGRSTSSTSAPGADGEADAGAEKELGGKPTEDGEGQTVPSLQVPPTTSPAATSLSMNPSVGGSSTPSPAPEARKPSAPCQSLEPPVTRSSLSQLEILKIVNNPQLRHDINFDPELHFRPNVEGDKGRRKHDQASIFWTALKEQLVEFIVDRGSFNKKYGSHTGDDWCLPKLLKVVKEIVRIIVPKRAHESLDEGLNVEFLMQQFHKGIADLEKLALWLSRTLKAHCAPMRDDWVDSMCYQLSSGNRNNDVDELVNGMRSLLSLLEAMRLDVADHQIRHLRPALIEETTAFEQEHLTKKLQMGEIDIADANPWYQDAAKRYYGRATTTSSAFGDMGIFFEGLSRSILPSAGDKSLPATFFFDEDRLRRVRSDVLDAINLDLCMRMLEDLGGIARSNTNTIVPDMNLRASLVALLQQAPHDHYHFNKWRSMAPSMALQMFRFINAPLDMLPAFEAKLTKNICNITSPIFKEIEEAYRTRLVAGLATRVRYFKSLSGFGLFSIATGSRTSSSSHGPNAGRDRGPDTDIRARKKDSGIEDIATRVAHIGVVHWRIWARMAYVDEDDKPMD